MRAFLTSLIAVSLSACMTTGPSTDMSPPGVKQQLTKAQPRGMKDEDEIRVHFVPVGAGSCQVVECPGEDAPAPMLIDCGTTGGGGWQADEVKGYVLGVLDQPANVVVSHPDTDHYSYLPSILEHPGQVSSLWIGGDLNRYNTVFRNWVRTLQNANVPVHSGFRANYSNNGHAVQPLQCGDADTFILTVNSGRTDNDQSMMLSVDYGGTHMIFPGDATDLSQNAAIRNFPDRLYSSLVVGSHHGADTHGSNNRVWANATKPDYVVFSSGTRHYHPRCTAANHYRETGYLQAAADHDFQCGVSGGWNPATRTSLSLYNTYDNGLITVDADQMGGNASFTCNWEPC